MSNTQNTKVDIKAMTPEQLAAMSKEDLIRALQQATNRPENGMKVTEKGAVSVYGFGRFPVTLYRSQWELLFSKVDAIKAFILANSDRLAVKPAKADKAA